MAIANYGKAVQDFWKARQQAGLEQIMSRWTGQSLDLLSFDEVRRALQAHTMVERGLHEIPLDAIVGSVGRYKDFTRTFLPRENSDAGRWAAVKVAYENKGLPPISVYQIGDTYFVQDGNHRVSVARQLGNATIEAYVTEVKTNVPLQPDMKPDDLILKAEYAEFLHITRFDRLRPDVDFSLTAAGKYPLLLEHIEVHRYYMGIDQQRDIPYEEAVAHWCDEVYVPTVHLIREAGLMHNFPERTEADLYVWLAEHRAEVEEAMGWKVPTGAAVADLAAQFGKYKPQSILGQVLNAVIPSSGNGTSVGKWRKERLESPESVLFARTLLVPIHPAEKDWTLLEQAILVAQREGSHVFGLYAVTTATEAETIGTRAIRETFMQRCAAANVACNFIVEEGTFEELICKRERWADVLFLRSTLQDQGSEEMIRRIIRRTSSPVLVLTGTVTSLDRPMLAYDDRPESDEALYLAAYLSSRWQVPLAVASVSNRREAAEEALAKAENYLVESGVDAAYHVETGEVVPGLLATAASQQSNLIILGSQRLNTMFQLVLGSTVRKLLQESPVPLLICR